MTKKSIPFLYTISLVLYACISFLVWGCTEKGQDQSGEPVSLSLHFEQELLIGDDGSISQEPMLVSPSEIRTDREGNIYISDQKLSVVQVFDADGNFLHSIGRAGGGPGEFGGINAIEINKQQELMTVDANNKRITRFSHTGEVLSNYSPAEGSVVWPRHFRQIGDNSYLLLRKKREVPGIKDQEDLLIQSTLLHHYDSTFSHLASFGHMDSLMNSSSDFMKIYTSTTNPGHFWPAGEGDIWYAPPIYDSYLFKFRKGKSGWVLAQTLRGQVHPEVPVELNSDMKGSMAIVIYTDEGTKSVAGYLKSTSLGIFKMKDGRLIHLSSQLQDGKRMTLVEVFNDEGKLEGVGQLEKFTFAATEQEALITEIWKDQEDQFYIIDKRDAPVIRMGRITGL